MKEHQWRALFLSSKSEIKVSDLLLQHIMETVDLVRQLQGYSKIISQEPWFKNKKTILTRENA